MIRMIASSNLIYALITTCLSVFFIFQEIGIISILKNSQNLETHLQKISKELPFYSYTKKINVLSKVIDEQEKVHSVLFEHNHLYKLGRLKLALALETTNTDDKILKLCEARDLFTSASNLSPNNVNYHISISDFESISPYLSSTCQNYRAINKDEINQNNNQISIQERLNLIKSLSPTDPAILYQKGLIEKNLGARINAMRDFRAFDENSIIPNSREIILYLLAQVQSEEEMKEIIPRKFPNIINWLSFYKNSQFVNKDFVGEFETPLIQTLEILEEKFNNNDISKQELFYILFNLYWSENTQNFSSFKNRLNKLIFKELTINGGDNNKIQKEVFKLLSSSNRLPALISTKLSSISKKTSQVYDWNHYQEESALGLNSKTDAIGIFIPLHEKLNTLVLQGDAGEYIPKDMNIEIWTSNDNSNYSLIKTTVATFVTQIGPETIALFKDIKIKSPYVKIYFTSNQKTIKLNSPVNLAIQIFETTK